MSDDLILTERVLIKMMRDEYSRRLYETIQEAEIFDAEGNMVIGNDLKVRHKKSQYEYTIDDVFEDPATGEIQVALRLPDEPRFEPPPDDEDILLRAKVSVPVLGEDELLSPLPATDMTLPPASDEEIFVIDQEEFEKEYEVK